MECWTTTYGGYNWTHPYMTADNVTHHKSINDAMNAFWRFTEDPHNMTDETTEMSLYLYNPLAEDVTDPYPDRRVFIGPRGGVRIETC